MAGFSNTIFKEEEEEAAALLLVRSMERGTKAEEEKASTDDGEGAIITAVAKTVAEKNFIFFYFAFLSLFFADFKKKLWYFVAFSQVTFCAFFVVFFFLTHLICFILVGQGAVRCMGVKSRWIRQGRTQR